MKQKRQSPGVLLLFAALLVFYFFGGAQENKGGAGISEVALPNDTAIKVHIADKNMKPIEQSTPLQSTLILKEGLTQVVRYDGVYFMRFDLKARNTGNVESTITLTDVKITDNNGNELQSAAVSDAFRCIINKPRVISSGGSYIWETTAAFGCGSSVWLSTPNFESVNGVPTVQPLHVIIKAKGDYNFFDITKTDEREVSLDLYLSADETNIGSYDLGIVGGDGSAFLAECSLTPVKETMSCPGADLPESACYNSYVSCFSFLQRGIWPECTEANYLSTYVAGTELSGGISKCFDRVDNDCDGFADRAAVMTSTSCTTAANCPNPETMTCVSGKCTVPADNDCTVSLVSFRTNAPASSTERLSDYSQKWISVDLPFDGIISQGTDVDGKLESYGYMATYSTTGTCPGIYQCASEQARSPSGRLRVSIRDYEVYLCELTDLNGNGKCDYSRFAANTVACDSGAEYPACLNAYPTEPYTSAGQETLLG